MNRRERLQDRYEDALFALLMDDIATMESKKAEEENERLQNDPSAAVPEDLDRQCIQLIHRYYAKQRARAAGRFTVKAMKRVALAAGIAAICFTTAFATFETVRVNTLNLMIEVFESNTEFRFSNSSEQTKPELKIGWVPEGYTLLDQGDNGIESWFKYQNTEGKTLSISLWQSDGMVAGIDTEDAEIEYIQVQNTQATLVKKGPRVQLVWAVEADSIFVSVWGDEIVQEDIIRIADEIQF